MIPAIPTVNFHGQKRSNETHQSTTDGDLRLFKKTKGSEAKLVYQGHVLMENRNGLVVNAQLTQASGTAERAAALRLLGQRHKRATLGADKAYDTQDFVADLRALGVTPHVAQNDKRRGGSAIDGRTTRHPGYLVRSTETQTSGRGLWLAEDRRVVAQDAPPRFGIGRVDLPIRDGSLQLGQNQKPVAGNLNFALRRPHLLEHANESGQGATR